MDRGSFYEAISHLEAGKPCRVLHKNGDSLTLYEVTPPLDLHGIHLLDLADRRDGFSIGLIDRLFTADQMAQKQKKKDLEWCMFRDWLKVNKIAVEEFMANAGDSPKG